MTNKNFDVLIKLFGFSALQLLS